MGLFKQLMIFGKTGLQGLPTRVTLFLWAFSRQGATVHNMGFCSRLGESPNTWKHFGPEPTQVLNSVISVLLRQETATWGGLDLGSAGVWRGITGGGSGYAGILAHAGGALYGTELGSVTLKRIGFFCFPIKHSTHTVLTLLYP
jgi:hypothetical protein